MKSTAYMWVTLGPSLKEQLRTFTGNQKNEYTFISGNKFNQSQSKTVVKSSNGILRRDFSLKSQL